jgi:dipeptidyl aminopeptidase/acylaminoacyl peptidase
MARVWDVPTAKEIAVIHSEVSVSNPAFSPDGKRIVTASENTVRVWDVETAKEIAVIHSEARVDSPEFSPDGKRVITASGKTARLWDVATAKEVAVLRGHESTVWSAAFSPDGTRIVTASSDWTARVWDVATAKQIAVLRGHSDHVYSAAFSPDSTRIVTASPDMTVRLWDVATAKQVAVLRGHQNTVWSASFSHDGKRVVTASADNTARLWEIGALPKGNLFAIACAALPDFDLTSLAREYGLISLEPICQTPPPLPDVLDDPRAVIVPVIVDQPSGEIYHLYVLGAPRKIDFVANRGLSWSERLRISRMSEAMSGDGTLPQFAPDVASLIRLQPCSDLFLMSFPEGGRFG